MPAHYKITLGSTESCSHCGYSISTGNRDYYVIVIYDKVCSPCYFQLFVNRNNKLQSCNVYPTRQIYLCNKKKLGRNDHIAAVMLIRHNYRRVYQASVFGIQHFHLIEALKPVADERSADLHETGVVLAVAARAPVQQPVP